MPPIQKKRKKSPESSRFFQSPPDERQNISENNSILIKPPFLSLENFYIKEDPITGHIELLVFYNNDVNDRNRLAAFVNRREDETHDNFSYNIVLDNTNKYIILVHPARAEGYRQDFHRYQEKYQHNKTQFCLNPEMYFSLFTVNAMDKNQLAIALPQNLPRENEYDKVYDDDDIWVQFIGDDKIYDPSIPNQGCSVCFIRRLPENNRECHPQRVSNIRNHNSSFSVLKPITSGSELVLQTAKKYRDPSFDLPFQQYDSLILILPEIKNLLLYKIYTLALVRHDSMDLMTSFNYILFEGIGPIAENCEATEESILAYLEQLKKLTIIYNLLIDIKIIAEYELLDKDDSQEHILQTQRLFEVVLKKHAEFSQIDPPMFLLYSTALKLSHLPYLPKATQISQALRHFNQWDIHLLKLEIEKFHLDSPVDIEEIKSELTFLKNLLYNDEFSHCITKLFFTNEQIELLKMLLRERPAVMEKIITATFEHSMFDFFLLIKPYYSSNESMTLHQHRLQIMLSPEIQAKFEDNQSSNPNQSIRKEKSMRLGC